MGNEAVGALPSDIDWQEVIDLSFEQGVAAIAVDGLGFAHDNENVTSYDDDTPSATITMTKTKTSEVKNR